MSTFSNIWRSSRWTLGAGLVKLVLQLIVFVLIGRMIDPSLLGEYFLAAAFVFLPMAVVEYSFNNSLIYQPTVGSSDRRAILGLNLIAYVIIMVLGFFLSFIIGRYYGYTQMGEHYLMLSPIMFLSAYSSVQSAQLRKDLAFRRYAIIDIIGSVALALVTILFLFKGLGVLAIIYGFLSRHLIVFLILLIYGSKKELIPLWNIELTRRHLDYGKYIIGEKSFGQLIGYSDSFIINHFFGAHMLGVYEVLKRIVFRPVLVAYESVEQVYFPMINDASGKRKNLNEQYHAFIRISTLSMLTFGLFICSDLWLPFLGQDYLENQLLLLLIIAGLTSLIILGPVDILSYSIDENKKFMWLTWIYGTMQIAAMIIAAFFSIFWVLIVTSLFNILIYLIARKQLGKMDKLISLNLWLRPVILWLVILGLSMLIWKIGMGILASMFLFAMFSVLSYYFLIVPKSYTN